VPTNLPSGINCNVRTAGVHFTMVSALNLHGPSLADPVMHSYQKKMTLVKEMEEG
jgi:hypothetical protein